MICEGCGDEWDELALCTGCNQCPHCCLCGAGRSLSPRALDLLDDELSQMEDEDRGYYWERN